jgi:hypothetical protein
LEATAMDVAAWLRALGLDQYEAAFRANGVDAEVLPTLTGEELKDIGVSSLRHRRRLLEAIAALRSNAMPAEAPARVSVIRIFIYKANLPTWLYGFTTLRIG